MAEIDVMIGIEQWIRLAAESTWGTTPGSPTYFDLPVDSFNLRNKPKRRNGQARTGEYQRRFGTNSSAMPQGSLACSLYGYKPSSSISTSIAQAMMEWAFLDQEEKFPRAKTCLKLGAGHEDDKQYKGLRVNQATLAGSESGIKLSLDLMGASATNLVGNATSPPNDREKLSEFEFEDATLTLDGDVVPFDSFQWQVQKNLAPKYYNSRAVQSLPKTSFIETFSVIPPKADSTWDVLRDELGMQECVAVLTLKGLHNGTGDVDTDFTQVVITFDRLQLIDSDEQGDPGVLMNPLTFDVLKPDTANAASRMTWSYEAAA